MKQHTPLLLLKLIAGLIIFSLGQLISASQVASIALYNLTSAPLLVHCQLANNTRFYAYPNQQSHDFNVKSQWAEPIDIHTVNASPPLGPNLLCTNYQNLTDWFNYTFIGTDHEKVEVSPDGHFHYNPSYMGSVTFESR